MSDINYKVLIELGDDISADRLCRLLQAIARAGSINGAAVKLNISYRHAWGLIKRAEERLQQPLLLKQIGGAQGGGARLTAAAQELLNRYERLQGEISQRVSSILGETVNTPAPPTSAPAETAAQPLLLASTIGPVESGLVTCLIHSFHRQTGILVRSIAAGSGQALDLGRTGRVDLTLTHAPKAEKAFIADGLGTGLYSLMYNDFVLLGPAGDPAGVRRCGSVPAAFAQIAARKADFVTRGDLSGTHQKELQLWLLAGVTPIAPWYHICPQGAMGSRAAAVFADQLSAYILVDRTTYIEAGADGLSLVALFEDSEILRNEFVLIPVSSRPGVPNRRDETIRFIEWATGPAGQAVIAEFGRDRYGLSLFRPIQNIDRAEGQ